MTGRKYTFLVFCIWMLQGCLSLHEVNKYADTSIQTLDRFNEVKYSFSEYCRQDCILQQLRSGKIDTSFVCDCELMAADADGVIQQIDTTIVTYLRAIEQLSSDKGFECGFSDLMGSAQKNGFLKLNTAQVSTISKAEDFIFKAAINYKRKKKLQQYLEAADAPFQELNDTYMFLLDNRLRTQLRIGYDTKIANLNQMIFNAENNRELKQILVKEYLDERSYYIHQDTLVTRYTKLLKAIKSGHHELYLTRKNLNSDETKKAIEMYLMEIRSLYSKAREMFAVKLK